MTIEVDEEDGIYRARIDWSVDGIDPSVAVVHAVLAASGRDERDLAPLMTAVDGDALDAIFEHATDADGEGGLRVGFSYEGFEVTLDMRGLTLQPPS